MRPLHKGKRGGGFGRDLTPLAILGHPEGAGSPPSPHDDCVKWRKRGLMPLSVLVGLVKTKPPRLGWRASAKWVGVECVPPPFFGAGAPAAESRMRGIPAKRGLKSGLLLACVLTAGLGLTACADIDNMFELLGVLPAQCSKNQISCPPGFPNKPAARGSAYLVAKSSQ